MIVYAISLVFTAVILRAAWKQAKKADDAPDNEADIKRRFNALEVNRSIARRRLAELHPDRNVAQ